MTNHRQQCWRASHRYTEGEVVIAWVTSRCERTHVAGKRRPVVLVRRADPAASGWQVACLTSRPSRSRRRCVTATAQNGLQRDGYLWGGGLTYLPAEDLYRPIGVVDPDLASTVIDRYRLGPTDASIIWEVAQRPDEEA